MKIGAYRRKIQRIQFIRKPRFLIPKKPKILRNLKTKNIILIKKNLFFETKTKILILISILFLVIVAGYYFNSSEKLISGNFVCGDETSYGECSLRKPYFCFDGRLIEKASICGCPQGMKDLEIENDKCMSKYSIYPKNVPLGYVLRGDYGQVNFTIYNGMADYVSNISRIIRYEEGETPLRGDFKIKSINEEVQKEFISPLVIEIQNLAGNKEDQLRIAISLVQKIPFGNSNKSVFVGPGLKTNYSRYPYEVLYDERGVCGEKSELLALMLKELGYSVVLFYHEPENHESLGVKCPVEQSQYILNNTGYCFVETTAPAIITDNEIEYTGNIRLFSEPEIIKISEGDSLGSKMYEYKDAGEFNELRKSMEEEGEIRGRDYLKWKNLIEKYGLVEEYNL